MTAAELQEIRALLYTQYKAWIAAGCPQSYTISANGATRAVTKVSYTFWTEQLASLDAQIAAASRGMFIASQFRRPE